MHADVFLKLGGSLITDKEKNETARLDTMRRLAGEIREALEQNQQFRLLLGHGSGSFGHSAAKKYDTILGVHTVEQWRGFVEVWQAAARLNRLVMDALREEGLPGVAFPPSAAVTTSDGTVQQWNVHPIRSALDRRLLPVLYGDVVFDETRGGTILSTEDLFAHLAAELQPKRILLAGIEPGVWADFPACTRLRQEITPGQDLALQGIEGSAVVDVTGGMASKVGQSLDLVSRFPDLEVLIFSGDTPGAVREAILGASPGTRIAAGT